MSALLFGMLHALEPGHGKSLVAVFALQADKLKKRDAILIGLLASITHTATVYIFGFASLKFLTAIFPSQKEIIINFVASIVIFAIGSWLVWDRIINPLFHHDYEHHCSVDKIQNIITKKLKTPSIFMVGLTAGLLPCSGGLAVFMTSTALSGFQNWAYGFLYVLSFSIGLGLALTLVALGIMFGQNILTRTLQKFMTNIEKASGVISAILIYTIGLILLVSNITTFTKSLGH